MSGFLKIPDRSERDWVTSSELVSITGLTYRQLDYEIRTGLLHAIDGNEPGSGHSRRFDHRQVARAQAIAALLGAGLSLQLLRTHIDAFVNTGRIDLGEIIIIARETP